MFFLFSGGRLEAGLVQFADSAADGDPSAGKSTLTPEQERALKKKEMERRRREMKRSKHQKSVSTENEEKGNDNDGIQLSNVLIHEYMYVCTHV
jgi:hypothetical protein